MFVSVRHGIGIIMLYQNICLNYDDAFVYFFYFFLSMLLQKNHAKTHHQELNFKLFHNFEFTIFIWFRGENNYLLFCSALDTHCTLHTVHRMYRNHNNENNNNYIGVTFFFFFLFGLCARSMFNEMLLLAVAALNVASVSRISSQFNLSLSWLHCVLCVFVVLQQFLLSNMLMKWNIYVGACSLKLNFLFWHFCAPSKWDKAIVEMRKKKSAQCTLHWNKLL